MATAARRAGPVVARSPHPRVGMNETVLDDFRDVGRWSAVAPGAARLRLTPFVDDEGAALRLDYDLGGNGFVIARRTACANPCAVRIKW